MSTKSSLKDKIKKPNATQAFFNSYDTDTINDKTNNNDDIKKDIDNINENNTDNINKNINDNNNDIENKTYVNNNNVVKDDIKKDIDNININENNTDNINKNIKDDNNDIENKTYVNNNNVVNEVIVEDEDDDYLRNLASGKKTSKKKAKKVFTSFYMDPDIAIEVDKIAARGEKGDKSKLINKAIRKLLEEYGVLEK